MQRLMIALLLTVSAAAQMPEPYRRVARLIWVVPDAEGTAEAWRRIGIPVDEPAAAEFRPAGGAPHGGLAASGYFANLRADWVQPAPGADPLARFLRERGAGVYALAYEMPDRDTWRREIERFRGAGVAVIEVSGSLVNRSSGMDAQSGLTSYEQLGNEILDAATDPQVRGILLRLDSYGGEANGAWDVASLIEEAARMKPVWAAVDDWALSAGYLLASAADRIWVTRTGGVGSVGIIAMHLDQSGWDAANGLRYTTIFAGDRKNDFNPHEPLSEGARSVLVAEVDRLYGMFVDAVARRRSLSAAAVRATQAGILYGEDSVAQGFADRVGTFRDALAAMTDSLAKPKFTKGVAHDRAGHNES